MLLGFPFSYRDSILLCNFSFQLLCVCVCVWKESQRKPSRKVVSPLILDRIKLVFLLNITNNFTISKAKVRIFSHCFSIC